MIPAHVETPTPQRAVISLPQIAALARVQRPVVSMWRRRFSEGADAFPPAETGPDGEVVFEAAAVATWLTDTGHGNNPEAMADVAAHSTRASFLGSSRGAAQAIESLLALRALDGAPLRDGAIAARAAAVDPDDRMLRAELSGRLPEGVVEFVDDLMDATYSPADAWERSAARGRGNPAAGTAGPLAAGSRQLFVDLLHDLVDQDAPVLVDAPGLLSTDELFVTAVAAIGDAAEAHVSGGSAERSVRRALHAHGLGHTLSPGRAAPRVAALELARLHGTDPRRDLSAFEDFVAELSDQHLALALGPDSLLTEQLHGDPEVSREWVLRSGRVRAIVRLPMGLIPSAPRQPLALWLVGGPQGEGALAERFTVIGDLRGITLTRARVADVVSDLLASLGTAHQAMAHSFRYLRFVRTSTLIAAPGSLTEGSKPAFAQAPTPDASELPALIDETASRLDVAPIPLRAVPGRSAVSVALADAIAAREARVLPGARLAAEDTRADDGYRVIGRIELLGETAVRRIDRFRLTDYPRVQPTLPGDVVFLPGSRPRAVVDVEGSSVVEYPARVLRLFAADLVPEVAAADVNALREPLPWRRWMLRRIPPGQAQALRGILHDLERERLVAARRAQELGELAGLVMAGAAAGVVGIDPPPADEEHNEAEKEGTD